VGRLVAGVLEVAEETLGLLLEVPPWELELADEVPKCLAKRYPRKRSRWCL
jgi:hypothetical protein